MKTDYELPALFTVTVLGIGQAVPIMAFALGCHVQIIPIYSELKKEKRKVMINHMFVSISPSTQF